jgi:hypothetical protein
VFDTPAVVASATRQDAAIDMSRTEGLIGRTADADVGREARLFHSECIGTVPMLATKRIALVTIL